jgi:hypothetical protein
MLLTHDTQLVARSRPVVVLIFVAMATVAEMSPRNLGLGKHHRKTDIVCGGGKLNVDQACLQGCNKTSAAALSFIKTDDFKCAFECEIVLEAVTVCRQTFR